MNSLMIVYLFKHQLFFLDFRKVLYATLCVALVYLCNTLKIRSLNWHNLYWKSDKRISRICEMIQRIINYDTKRKQSNRKCLVPLSTRTMSPRTKICKLVPLSTRTTSNSYHCKLVPIRTRTKFNNN
jgi:hypothetical protein